MTGKNGSLLCHDVFSGTQRAAISARRRTTSKTKIVLPIGCLLACCGRSLFQAVPVRSEPFSGSTGVVRSEHGAFLRFQVREQVHPEGSLCGNHD
jgi:hypothetical protein